MRGLSEPEINILITYLDKGYKWAAFNSNHARLFECDEKPFLKGSMYRVEDGETTILGVSVFGSGLFEDIGYGVIDLNDLSIQGSLF